MDGVIAFFIIVLGPIFGFFFLYQLIEKKRTPYRVFFSPISNKEFKVLADIIEKGSLEESSDLILDKEILVNKGQFKIQYNWVRETWCVNGVNLSYFQEKALLKAVARNRIKSFMLTNAGKVLFTKNEN